MRKPICVLVLVLLALAVAPAVSAYAELPPGGTFTDDDGSIFEGAIEAIAAEGITEGCNPPANTSFCPDDFVTRGEMAVFLVRAMGYTDNGGGDLFLDDDGLFYEDAADKLIVAGVTNGCTSFPPNNRFCGERYVTREVMAAFLVRAFGYTDDGGGNLFIDYYGTFFGYAIDRLFVAGITQGCNPPVNDRYCPLDPVTRGEMAAFLTRALHLSPVYPPASGSVAP
ncbi:MAG TPA: S-layer homology domain-containing protein [Acidimicrobiia bacterium]